MPLGNLAQQQPFSKREMQSVVKQSLEALEYLHDKQNITHRDIKPENVLVKSKIPTMHVKLCDFGLSKLSNVLSTFCGTLLYLAPEIARKGRYDKSVDIWALGVLSFQFLLGIPVEPERSGKILPPWSKLWAEALHQDLSLPKHWKNSEVTSLLKRMLHQDPNQRPSAKACLLDLWFQDPLPSSPITREQINKATIHSMSEQSTIILDPPIDIIPATHSPSVSQKRTRSFKAMIFTDQTVKGDV